MTSALWKVKSWLFSEFRVSEMNLFNWKSKVLEVAKLFKGFRNEFFYFGIVDRLDNTDVSELA